MKELKVRFYNHSNVGNHTLIGSAKFSMAKVGEVKKFSIKAAKDEGKGTLVFHQTTRTVKHEFGDYIESGLQLALVNCIDFTASNGDPISTKSLHYVSGGKKSEYEEAMSEVLNILMDYDYDKLIPCFGFGAQVFHPNFSSQGRVHHCFPLNFNASNPTIYQKDEIIKCYRNIFKYIKLSGPTKFA